MSINKRLDKQMVTNSSSGVLYQNENTQIIAAWNNVKLDKRGQTQKRIYIMIPSSSSSDQTHCGARGQGSCYLGGWGGGGGKDWGGSSGVLAMPGQWIHRSSFYSNWLHFTLYVLCNFLYTCSTLQYKLFCKLIFKPPTNSWSSWESRNVNRHLYHSEINVMKSQKAWLPLPALL